MQPLVMSKPVNRSRIERYTRLATPVTAIPTKPENSPLMVEKRPVSPSSSVKTNASSNTEAASTAQQYQQFPSQAARIPTAHTQSDIGGPLQHAATFSHPQRERGAVEGSFADLHLSGSEPRIFPGVVSKAQRRDSQARKASWSETDESVKSVKRRGTKDMDGAVEEEELEESDGYLEDAGGDSD